MRVLCATDLLPKSEAAVERAGMMADRLAADLSLLHVVVPTQSERALEQDLQRAIAQLKSRSRPPLWQQARTPNVIVKVGGPANRIVETVSETGATLAVLGPHRERGARDALSGTVAENVLSSRSAPVLIVKRQPRTAYRRVLLALDLSETSAGAVRTAEALAVTKDTHAVVVHAYEPYYEGMLASAGVRAESIRAYAARWARDAGPQCVSCSSARAAISAATTLFSSRRVPPPRFCAQPNAFTLTCS